MKISNTVYLSYPFNATSVVSVSLAKDEHHSYEHLNEPTAGYHPVKSEDNVVYLKHPRLELNAAMPLETFVKLSMNRHCSEALLVFDEDGTLLEYQQDSMTIEVIPLPRQYEQRYIKKRSSTEQPTSGSVPMYFVQHINYTTLKATVIELSWGQVTKKTVSVKELLSKWEISPVPLRSDIYNVLPQCIEPSSRHKIDIGRLNNPVSFDREKGALFYDTKSKGLVANRQLQIAGFGPLLSDAIDTNSPVLVHSRFLSKQSAESFPLKLVFGQAYYTDGPVYIVHSSLLAKHWDTFPFGRSLAWQKLVHDSRPAKMAPEYKTFSCDALPNVVGTSMDFYALFNIQNQVWNALIRLQSFVNEQGVFGVLKCIQIHTSQSISAFTQRAILEHLTQLQLPNEATRAQFEVKEDRETKEVWLNSFVPCSVSAEAVSSVQKEIVGSLKAAIPFSIDFVRVPYYKRGDSTPEHSTVPFIQLACTSATFYPDIKKQLL